MRKLISFCLPFLASLSTAQPPADPINLLLTQARQEIAQSNFAAAETDLNSALEKSKKTHDYVHELLAYEAFGSLKEKQGYLGPAEQWLTESVDASQQLPGPGPQLATLLNLEGFYARHNLHAREAGVLSQIIEIWSGAVGPNSVAVARYTSTLGQVDYRLGDYAASELNLKLAISVFDKAGMTSSPAAVAAKRALLQPLEKEDKQGEITQLSASLPPVPEKLDRPDVQPVLISKTEPSYPEEARKRNLKLSGSVMVNFDVDANGAPQNVQVIAPLGLGFDENALAAVRTWRFKPATKGGVPVPARATVEVNFRVI